MAVGFWNILVQGWTMKRGGLIPNQAETEFLQLSYNRFYNLYDEIMKDSFWKKDPWYRFSRIKEGFAVYSELLNYLPIQWTIRYFKKIFPPSQAELAEDFFKFIRNLFIHFPLFEEWDKVYITKNLATWSKTGQINSFLEKCKGKNEIKYRLWEEKKKKMTYLSIIFPKRYEYGEEIYLRDILREKEGAKFSFSLMKKILDSQVVRNRE